MDSTRQAQKRRTRRALLDAALHLMEDQSLNSLSLRELTRQVGIVPAAFYRHFRDISDLGIALVEESLGTLRGLVRATRANLGDADTILDRSMDLLRDYVHANSEHFRFICREKYGSVAPVREAIRVELRLFTEELASDMLYLPDASGWERDDREMLAGLIVNHMVLTAAAILDVPADQPEFEHELLRVARTQLQLILVGRRHWLEDRVTADGSWVVSPSPHHPGTGFRTRP